MNLDMYLSMRFAYVKYASLIKSNAHVYISAGDRFEYDPRFKQVLHKGSEMGFRDNQAYDIVVDHMPSTEWGRIHWYLDHKANSKINIISLLPPLIILPFGMSVMVLLMARNLAMGI